MPEQEAVGMLRGFAEQDKMTEQELAADIAELRPMLYRLAYSYLGNAADCDDVMQDVFIKLFFRGRCFPDAQAKKAWLIRVTINCCKNRLSHWWNKRRGELPETPAEDECYPELDAALRQLKPAYRAVIHLHYYEGYSAAETAKLLGISTTAVTTRLQRGREKLKDLLE